ncbi:MAG TPA: [FeFe] hydrogenase, group A [Polyangiaceae bacterium]|nr:[FeFe] hydrogenase, group A [Polyangiaceae bacterium]
MGITINGQNIDFTPGETVLKVAKRAGIHIPNLCSLEWADTPTASCRMCLVEVEGMPRLMTSCTLEAKEGMVVRTHTKRVVDVRRNLVELLVANHPQDCLVCSRNGDCELQTLSEDLGVRERRYSGIKKNLSIDLSSPAIVRDPNKCILCGRCVTTCHAGQGVGAIDFACRGFKTRVAPSFHLGLNVSECVFCGQCVRVCPTGALTEKSHISRVLEALADPDKVVVAQIAPAVPATLQNKAEAPSVRATLERMAGALKRIGFRAVFDTAFTADLTIMEEVSELIHRVQTGGVLPMMTSCSPGWVQFVELHHPELIPHMSTCKSPQQMAGALIKEVYPRYLGIDRSKLVCVSVMPCTAKKFEAHDQGDVDFVLTTREFEQLLERHGMSLDRCTDRVPLDPPFSEATGAGRLFGGTGGVMEAAIRTAVHMLTGADMKNGPKISEVRGLDGLKTLSLEVGGAALNFAVVNGLGRVKPLIDPIAAGQSNLHFIEVMTCPGGCIGGGGQPLETDMKAVQERLERLYDTDRRSRNRTSHSNEEVQSLYATMLGRPLGEVSHHLLHRKYIDRRKEL